MKDKNIILALTHGVLRDELLLYFGHNGARVFLAFDAESLIKHLRSNTIDCIVTQMILAKEDSIELILKVLDINKDIPIVLIDQTEKQNTELAKRLKVAAYFHKPFSSFDIYEHTEKLARSQKMVEHKDKN
jgi:DNA-binding NtrC family response regulator